MPCYDAVCYIDVKNVPYVFNFFLKCVFEGFLFSSGEIFLLY